MAKRKDTTNDKPLPKGTAPVLIQNIVIRPTERGTQDIGKWRDALKFAESDQGHRVRLYDLYEDVLLDGHLTTVLEKRTNAVKNTELAFIGKDGKPVEALSDLMRMETWETLLEEIMNARYWGISLVQITPNPIAFESLPRKHVRPREGRLVWEQYGTEGIDYRQPPYNRYLLEVGKKTDMGIILKACQYVIYKRGNFGDWAQFAEIFGMPFRVGRYDGYDEKTRIELETALDKAGSAAYAVIPKEGTIEFLENKSTGSSDLYDKLNNACNREISKLVLGQTETTESSQSSGHAQAKIHGETEDDINKADRRFVAAVLNEKVLPLLALHGWPVEGGRFVFPKSARPLTVAEIIELSDRLPIGQQYVYDTLGIPVPEEGEKVLQAATPPATDPPAPDDNPDDIDDPSDPDPVDKEKDKEVKLFERFRSFFDEARLSLGLGGRAELLTYQVNKLYQPCQQCGGMLHGPTAITLAKEDTDKIIEAILGDVYYNRLEEGISRQAALQIASRLMDAIMSGYPETAMGGTADDRLMLIALESNIYDFSGAKTYRMAEELTKLLYTSEGAVRGFAAFRKEAATVMERHVGNWLRTEYNHAVATAQMSANWVHAQANKATLPNLTYRAVLDARTSDEHRLLHGTTRPQDDAFWRMYYPPNRYNCRCTATPTSTSRVTTDEELAALSPERPAKGFDTNLAAEGKAFPAEHPYFKDLPPQVLEVMAALKPAQQ